MRATLLVLLGFFAVAPASAAAPPKAAAKAPPAKAEPAKAEDAPLSPEALRRIAIVEPAPCKGVGKPALKKLADSLEGQFKEMGYEIVPPPQVVALHLKRKLKAPACTDAPDCLAKVGKVAGVGYVGTVFISQNGKNFGVKLMIVDSADASLAANIMGLVPKATDDVLLETLKKQVPRAATSLAKKVAEKEALAAAAAATAAAAAAVVAEPAKPEPAPVEPKPVEAKPAETKPADTKPAETKPAVAQPAPVEPKPAETKPAVAQPAPVEPKPDAKPGPAAVAVAPVAPPDASAQAQVEKPGPGPVPWALFGGGLGVAVVGMGVFGTLANNAADDFQSGVNALDSRNTAKGYALACDVAVGVGAAAALVGVGWLVYHAVSGPDAPPPAVQPSVAVTPSGASVAISGSF